MEFKVEAAQLVNEGGVQCVPLVFARPLDPDLPVTLAEESFLKGARVAALDPARAARHGPGVVAFILDDPMDVRWFSAGEVVRLESR
jgi:hypothetical protein